MTNDYKKIVIMGALFAMSPQLTEQPKIQPEKQPETPKKRVVPKGCKLYVFEDLFEFECIASSQKIADYKFAKFLKSIYV